MIDRKSQALTINIMKPANNSRKSRVTILGDTAI